MRSAGLKTQGQMIAPSVNRDWTPEDVFNTNFLVDFSQELGIITVEKYVTTCGRLHQSNFFCSGILPITVLPFSTLVGSTFVPWGRF